MRRSVRGAVAAAVAATSLLATPSPASAALGGVVTFDIVWRTAPLGLPGLHGGVTHSAHIIGTQACAAAAVASTANAGECTVTGSGILTGLLGGAYCGNGVGVIGFEVVITNPFGTSTSAMYYLSTFDTGTAVVGTGAVTVGTESGSSTLVGSMTPTGNPVTNPTAGSCLDGTASEFRLLATVTSARVL